MKPVGPLFPEVKPVVGAFVLGALLIALGLVLATARARRWFERVVPIEIQLPEEGSFGLRRGSGVEMLGSVVGSIDEIWIDDQNDTMKARILLQTAFHRFVRIDSRFLIKRKTLGLAGDAYVEISRGAKAQAPLDQRFAADVDREPTELLRELSGELLPTIRSARALIESHQTLATALADPGGDLMRALQRANTLLTTLERAEGIAGRVIHDRTWATKFDTLLVTVQNTLDELRAHAGSLTKEAGGAASRASALFDDARSMLTQLREILDRLAEATKVLPELAATVRDESRHLPGTIAHSRSTLAEVEKLVLALQDHWLIRGYVPPTTPRPRLAPSELGTGGARR